MEDIKKDSSVDETCPDCGETHGEAGHPVEAEADDGVPAIVKTLIYYGLGQDKKPDPSKILYYERPDGSVIDCSTKGVLGARPAVLDHLPSRFVTAEDKDVVSAMIHGAMSDDDYDALSEKGILSGLACELWHKLQQLKALTETPIEVEPEAELTKSDDMSDEGAEPMAMSEGETEEPEAEAVVETETAQEGLPQKESQADSQGEFETFASEIGSDVLQEIMTIAMSAAANNMGVLTADDVRSIAREVFEQMMSGSESEAEPAQEQDTPEPTPAE